MVGEAVRKACPAGYGEELLRAFLDGEIAPAWLETLRTHVPACGACAERVARLRVDGALAHGRLNLLRTGADQEPLPVPPRPAVAAVLARAKARQTWRGRVAAWWPQVSSAAPAWRPLPLAAGSAVAAVLLAGAALTQPAVQSFAQSALQSFRVQKVQPVTVDLSALEGGSYGKIDEFFTAGTYSGSAAPKLRITSTADAAKATGLKLRAPATIPAQIKGARTVLASDPIAFSVTYDGTKLVQAAQDNGVTDVALLAELRSLDGVTAKASIPAAAAFVYGDPYGGTGADKAAPAQGAGKPGSAGAAGSAVGAGAAGGAGAPNAPGVVARATAARNVAERAAKDQQPFLALVELKSPSVELSKDVNADQLRQQLLRSGVLPPALASQLLAVADWKSTLPIPVTKGSSKQVNVDGTTATVITGESPALVLIWQKDGVLYVMGGLVSEQQLVDAARSLAPAR